MNPSQDILLVQGHGVCDHNSFERAMNVISSVPYTLIGLHTLRCDPVRWTAIELVPNPWFPSP